MQKLKTAVLGAVGAVSAAVVSLPAMAQATGNAAQFETVFTTLKTDFGTLIGFAIGAAVVVWGGYLVFRIARKLTNKVA